MHTFKLETKTSYSFTCSNCNYSWYTIDSTIPVGVFYCPYCQQQGLVSSSLELLDSLTPTCKQKGVKIKGIQEPLKIESKLYEEGYNFIAGVDEAGRGPLAGPVVSAAVILPKGDIIKEINDSKKLTEKKRFFLYEMIKETALAIGIGIVDNRTIDKINILQATLLSAKIAINKLEIKPDFVLYDGDNPIKDIDIKQTNIINGDAISQSIAAASIIAKVTRDRIITEYHNNYPAYNFAKHKGYGTKEHLNKIKEIGPCPIHRFTFKGVK